MIFHGWESIVTVDGKETTIQELYYSMDGFSTASNELIPFLVDPCSAILISSARTDRETMSSEVKKIRAAQRREKVDLVRAEWAAKHGVAG